MAVIKAGAKVAAFTAAHIHQVAVLDIAVNGADLCLINPGVAFQEGRFPLGGNRNCRIGTHGAHRLSEENLYILSLFYHIFPRRAIY